MRFGYPSGKSADLAANALNEISGGLSACATLTSEMILSAGPPVLLGLTVAALVAIRARSVRVRLVVEGLLLLDA